jgi:hypothetical protein
MGLRARVVAFPLSDDSSFMTVTGPGSRPVTVICTGCGAI